MEYILAALAIVFSLSVILQRNPVASAFSLIMVLLSFAGIYAMMGAHFVAGFQVLVYAGAVTVLFVFVILLLNSESPPLDLRKRGWPLMVVAGLVAVAGVALVSAAVSKQVWTPKKIEIVGGNTRALAEVLYTGYLVPFELVSVLLLAALVAAVAFVKRRGQK